MWATLIDYTHATGDGAYDDLVTQALPWQVGDSGDFITHNWTLTAFNQDLGLWGMATMLAAERGFPDPPPGKPQWLNLSRNVFDALAGRYDDTACGGGLRLAPYPLQAGHDYKDSRLPLRGRRPVHAWLGRLTGWQASPTASSSTSAPGWRATRATRRMPSGPTRRGTGWRRRL